MNCIINFSCTKKLLWFHCSFSKKMSKEICIIHFYSNGNVLKLRKILFILRKFRARTDREKQSEVIIFLKLGEKLFKTNAICHCLRDKIQHKKDVNFSRLIKRYIYLCRCIMRWFSVVMATTQLKINLSWDKENQEVFFLFPFSNLIEDRLSLNFLKNVNL